MLWSGPQLIHDLFQQRWGVKQEHVLDEMPVHHATRI